MSLVTIVAAIFEKYADRPAIGTRVKRVVSSESGERKVHWESRYQTQTYSQLWAKAGHLAASLYHHPIAPVRADSTVAMLSFTNADYAALDIACIRLGALTVPLQTGTSWPDLLAILDETRPTLLACSVEQLEVATACIAQTPSIQRLIILDAQAQSGADAAAIEHATATLQTPARKVEVSAFHDTVAAGKTLPDIAPDERLEDDEALAMLIYTSGSTGAPKGAMYTRKLAAGMWGGSWATIFSEDRAITFHYMPMSHVAGHSSLKSTLARGGTCFFTAQATLSTLIEDISLVKPTELSLVPRVCEMIYQRYQGELARYDAIDGDPRANDILETMRAQDMGGCVTWASCSSAPIAPELSHFMERLLGLALHNVYGSTEAGAVWIDNELLRPPVEDYRLRDVPELGYYLTDHPYPRGELLLKTTSMIPGYYQRPELNAELLDESGYYLTGDIVARQGDNRLHFVDRRKNVVKLSQGEFVALARLETLFSAIADLDSIFVHANSTWSYPLAVIVPTERLRARCEGNEVMMRAHLLEAIRGTAKESGLRSFEIPRDFILASERFTQHNGMLSDHGKPLWPRLRQRYEGQLDTLYENIKSREMRQLQEVHRSAGLRPAIEVVLQAARTVLGIPAEGINPAMHFRDLGADSLSALTLASLLSQTFSVTVGVDLILSDAYDLQRVADAIEAKASSDAIRPSAQHIHGKDATVFHASHLTLDKFLSPEVLGQTDALASPRLEAKTLLLTGATGFLGRFLCLDLLERIDREGGKLICIVRGKNSNVAKSRLLGAFGGIDSAPARRVVQLSAGLEVVAGDIGEERLGLDMTTWARLTREVDTIIHCGAVVNHLLPYKSLFDANVNGTAQLIALALTHHLKPISFMSSIAVSTLTGETPEHPLDEYQDIRQWASIISAEDTYAAGYGLTKWAGEVLLREAHEQFGLPVTVYRSSMILAHGREPGQLNVADMFTRLLLSLAATGLAPASFYEVATPGSMASAHYDGLPVDFTAAAIIKTSVQQPSTGYRSFNLVNHHDDGISLDVIVEWMRASGVNIQTINDYSEWLRRFSDALRGLPDLIKSQSILPLLHGFASPHSAHRGSTIPSDRFQSAIAQGHHQPLEVARIDKALIERYVADLRALGLLSTAPPSSKAVG
jgi:fatty acid CoA ligase FadD9